MMCGQKSCIARTDWEKLPVSWSEEMTGNGTCLRLNDGTCHSIFRTAERAYITGYKRAETVDAGFFNQLAENEPDFGGKEGINRLIRQCETGYIDNGIKVEGGGGVAIEYENGPSGPFTYDPLSTAYRNRNEKWIRGLLLYQQDHKTAKVEPDHAYPFLYRECLSCKDIDVMSANPICQNKILSDHGQHDELVNEWCKQNPQRAECSCSADGLAFQFGGKDNVSSEITLNPVCTYGKCANYGYKNANQLKNSYNCPAINVCNLKTDVSKIQDEAVVSNINQSCSFGNITINTVSPTTAISTFTAVDPKPDNVLLILVVLVILVAITGTCFIVWRKKTRE